MSTPTVVAEDWAFDPLEPRGAAELYQRLETAEPRRVRRTQLEGHVGLTPRELHDVGCTLEPPGRGGAVGWRLAVVAGALIGAVLLAVAVAGVADALGVPRPEAQPIDRTTTVVSAALALGGLLLMQYGVWQLRRRTADRRRATPGAALRPSDDPHGRATVATLRGPGVLRVQLLWVRGDPRNTRYAEVHTLAERQIEDGDAGRAEDAVAHMSEIALRADRAHALRHESGLAALGVRRFRRRHQPAMTAAPPAHDHVEREVGFDWRPEPLTEDGQAELARRLVTADVERWSASVLEWRLVTSAADAPRWAPPWPERHTEERAVNDVVIDHRVDAIWYGVLFAALAVLDGGDLGERIVVAGVALAVAAVAAAWPRLYELGRPGGRLTRTVRAAAAGPPRALEHGLPGAAGLFAVARGRGRGIALVHVRPAIASGRRGELEVRTLARLPAADDDLDALGTFCAIAAEAQLQSHAAGHATRTLRSLMARLGRVPAGAGEPRLREEPLAWAAALPLLALLALSVTHTVAGTWLEDGVIGRSLGFAALLFASYLLVRAARQVRDPYARQ